MEAGRGCACTCCRTRSRHKRRPTCARSHATTGRWCCAHWEHAMNDGAAPGAASERALCGPEGCTIDWLVSERIEVDDDPVAFQKLATDAGWGDGLPLVPPTEARVRELVAASGRFPDEVIADVPPRNGRATVEKVAVNAVMAGGGGRRGAGRGAAAGAPGG